MTLQNFHFAWKNIPLHPVGWSHAPHYLGKGYNFYIGDHVIPNVTDRSGSPTATEPPYCRMPAPKGSLLSSTTVINGVGDVTGNAAMGVAVAADLDGTGELISPSMALITSCAATLAGIGGLTASMSNLIQLAATLAGEGNLTVALKLLAGITATLTGSGTIDATSNLKGKSFLEAHITPFTELSPEGLAAAVWNALADSFDNPDTMGELLHEAAAGGGGGSGGGVTIREEEFCQGGGYNYIVLNAAASATNNIYVNSVIVITAGTGEGQNYKVTQYNGATKKAIINGAWIVIPDVTSKYVMVPQ
jgi:hypothetical protein